MIEPRNKRGEHEVCRWSLAGSNDGHEWVELHAGNPSRHPNPNPNVNPNPNPDPNPIPSQEP